MSFILSPQLVQLPPQSRGIRPAAVVRGNSARSLTARIRPNHDNHIFAASAS